MRCASKRRTPDLARHAGAAGLLLAGSAAFALASPGESESPLRPGMVSIELRPQVEVDRGPVRLGDVAYLTGHDLPTLRRLLALPVASAPRAAVPTTLDRDRLMRWVATRNSGSETLQWRGATQTEITVASQTVSGETMAIEAQAALRRWLAQRQLRGDVQPSSGVHDVVVPAGSVSLHIRPFDRPDVRSGRMPVWVEVWVERRFVRLVALGFALTLADAEPTAAAIDRAAATVTETASASASASASSRTASGAAAVWGVPAHAAASSVADSSAMAENVTTDAIAVPRGSWVQLQSREGEVSVEGRGESLQDGRVGQTVRVRVRGARAEILARVTGRGEVAVQP